MHINVGYHHLFLYQISISVIGHLKKILFNYSFPSQNMETKKCNMNRASLVAQWLGVCLMVQGTRVRALVWEDPTCRGAAGPVSHGC